jgi:N-acyl-D-amino-acid deacylase
MHAASDRHFVPSNALSSCRPGLWAWVMDQVAEARARGADLRPQTSARGTGIVYGLVGRTSYDDLPAWAELMARPWEARVAALADEGTRRRLQDEADEPRALSGPLAPKDPAKLYLLPPGRARYDVAPANSLAAEAERRQTTPAGAFLAFTVETGGRGLLYHPVLNQDLDAVAQMLINPDVVVGVADAGAHVALTMDAGQTTYLLEHWVRERGLLDVGRAVAKLSREGAELYGIPDRGVLAPGAYADVNVIDLDRLGLDAPAMVADFPLGAQRYVQRAHGYELTLVNGRALVEADELTDERPGRVVRPGAGARR